MKTVQTIQDVRSHVRAAVRDGRLVGLVPTMGALHAGHASLIDRAASECGFVVVSLFVNPTQFGPSEDLAAYPRTPQQDAELCEPHGADLLFAPEVSEMYPHEGLTTVHVRRLPEALCGRSRPGHFDGVCTVVAKLLHIALPDRVYFGAKDYQQGAIVRQMVRDLDFPVEVVLCATVREADGLAMSSRNVYLTPAERAQAPALYEALQIARRMAMDHPTPAPEVTAAIRAHLAARAPDAREDYIHVVDARTLQDVEIARPGVLVALAVRLGKARLIDNIVVGE